MKHSCCVRYLSLVLLLTSALFASLDDKSAMVYYGKEISYPMVGIHDYIIVQPENTKTYTYGFKQYKKKIYAYVSIGEAEKEQVYFSSIKKEWLLGRNVKWNSNVVDIGNREYHEFLFADVIEPLLQKGFENFFFDTLDSYQSIAENDQQRIRFEKGLIRFIREFRSRYPDSKLIINRGFEIIDSIHDAVDAVLFESFYYGLVGDGLKYKAMSENDRNWLRQHIKKIHAYDLPVISVDYLDIDDTAKADEVIKAIKKEGMIPYIADRDLMRYGRSSKNAVKREVLMLYDGSQNDVSDLDVHLFGSLPLEYMGYIPVLHDIAKGLPDPNILDRFAGVIIWLDDYHINPNLLVRWVDKIQRKGIYTLFFRSFGFKIASHLLSPLGIDVVQNRVKELSKNRITLQDNMIGYEMNTSIRHHSFLLTPSDSTALLRYENRQKQSSTLAAITPWGGYAIDEAAMIEFDEDTLWVANPFKLFPEALRLKPLPSPDPTTENGRRLLFTHVDGDGIMNRAEWDQERFSGDVILNEILKRYAIPHSVSIIEGETAKYGLYPKDSYKLVRIARAIYQLNNVEAATHTFSHPYAWQKISEGQLDKKYRLNVPDYTFSVDRELKGSLDYINSQLLTPDKPKADMIFWSGDCLPQSEVLEYVNRHGYLNMNGGDTDITRDAPWLTKIAPYGLFRDEYFQTYTGAQNENIYTNDWLGPFWAFKKVIQTFELTDHPRRFKPIDIYYHLYSGSKRASLHALKTVFDWALKQETMPIYASEYIPKVNEFYNVSMAEQNGKWLIDGMHTLRTIRIPDAYGGIDMRHSKGVVGYKKEDLRTYVHLDQQQPHHIQMADNSDNGNYLIEANGALVKSSRQENRISMHFRGHVPLTLSYHLDEKCTIKSIPKADVVKIKKQVTTLTFKTRKEAQINVRCQK